MLLLLQSKLYIKKQNTITMNLQNEIHLLQGIDKMKENEKLLQSK